MNSKLTRVAGWILSLIPALFLLSGAVTAWLRLPAVLAGMTHLGYAPAFLTTLAFLELICPILFLIPRTSFFGAILLTAYFGGAVASHLRVGEGNWIAAVIFGAVVWIGLLLRDQRLRAYCMTLGD